MSPSLNYTGCFQFLTFKFRGIIVGIKRMKNYYRTWGHITKYLFTNTVYFISSDIRVDCNILRNIKYTNENATIRLSFGMECDKYHETFWTNGPTKSIPYELVIAVQSLKFQVRTADAYDGKDYHF